MAADRTGGTATDRAAQTADATRKRPVLFLDRDGVLNVEVHRLHRVEDAVLIPGAAKAVATVNGWGIPVVVVTNQAGIGHGLYDEAAYRAVNARLGEMLAAEGAHIDAFFHCPHTPADACRCRKPLPGMLEDAARQLNVDLGRSVLAGDKLSDLEAARAAGCAAILVRTGYGATTERDLLASGDGASRVFDVCRDSLLAAIPDIALVIRG